MHAVVRESCIVLVIVILSAGYAFTKEEVAGQKQKLSAQLDSLEMLKQQRKRNGEPMADLEAQCKMVRDSIAALKQEIVRLSEEGLLPPPQSAARKGFPIPDFRSLAKNRSILDWAVLAVGIAAVLAGILLVFGIIRAIANKSSRPKTSGRAVRPKQPQSAFRQQQPPQPSVSRGDADIDNEGIEALRQRVSQDYKRIQRFDTQPSAAAKTSAQSDIDAQQNDGQTLRDKILLAASQGLDVGQISKRYHISADQVSLILRVARDGKQDK